MTVHRIRTLGRDCIMQESVGHQIWLTFPLCCFDQISC
jgi:hypothetical protein